MKKLFTLFSIFLLSIFFCNTVSAQTDTTKPSSQGTIVATVNLYNAKIVSQKDRDFVISFDLSNRVGAQPQIKYSVRLTKASSTDQTIFDEKVYDEVLSLGENASTSKTINYTIPASLSAGTYELWVESKNGNGLMLGTAYLGEINITETIASNIEIIPESCYLMVGTTQSPLSQMLAINSTDTLTVKCKAESNFSRDITLIPNFITRAHTSFGEIVTATGSSKENITIKTGTNDITLTLPKAETPQSYNLTFNLTSSNPKTITNTITFNYALMGENGTIQNVVFDKTSYKTGETANLQIFSTQTSTGTLAVLVSNDSNAPCSTTSIKQIDSFSIINLQIPIIKDCTNPKANITLSSNDKVLDSSNFEITTPVSTTTLITLTNKNIIIIIALIILALIFTILIFKKKSLKVLIFIFILSSTFFGLSRVSYAWGIGDITGPIIQAVEEVVEYVADRITPPPPTIDISYSPNPVPYNTPAVISYRGNNASGCVVSGGTLFETNGPSPWEVLQGSWGRQVTTNNLTSSINISVTCTGIPPIVIVQNSVRVSVVPPPPPPPPPTITLTATPNPVPYNSPTTISWSSTGADSCEITSGQYAVSVPTKLSGCEFLGGTFDSALSVCYLSSSNEAACQSRGGTYNSCYKPPCSGRCIQSCRTRCTVPGNSISPLGNTSGSTSSISIIETKIVDAKCTNQDTSTTRSVTINPSSPASPIITSLKVNDQTDRVSLAYGATDVPISWTATGVTGKGNSFCTLHIPGETKGTPSDANGSGVISTVTARGVVKLVCTNPTPVSIEKQVILEITPAATTIEAGLTTVLVVGAATHISGTMTNYKTCKLTKSVPNEVDTTMFNYDAPALYANRQSIPIDFYKPSGSITKPTTFSLSCSSFDGVLVNKFVVVSPPPPPTVSLQAERDTIPTNSSTTLTGTVKNSTSCTLTGRPTPPGHVTWTSNDNFSYSSGNLALATTFTVSCNGLGGGPVSRSKTVSVSPLPIIDSFQANPNPVMFRDGTLELSFSVFGDSSRGCKMFRGKDEIKSFAGASSGSFTGNSSQTNIKGTTNFKLSCTNSMGTSEKSINVTTKPIPITLEMSANGNHSSSLSFPPTKTYEIDRGKSLTISWSSTGADSCGYEKLQKGNSLEKLPSIATSGSTSTGKMLSETTFVIHCENESLSSVENQVKILVIQPPIEPPKLRVDDNGDQRKIIWGENWDQYDSCSYKKEGDTTETSFNPGETPDLPLEDTKVTYTFTCENEKYSQSKTIVVLPSIRSICTVLQSGNTSGNIYVNRNTTWKVEPYSNLVKEITSRTWSGTNIATTTDDTEPISSTLDKIYTTVGKKSITTTTTGVRSDGTRFTSVSHATTTVKLDTGSNEEI